MTLVAIYHVIPERMHLSITVFHGAMAPQR